MGQLWRKRESSQYEEEKERLDCAEDRRLSQSVQQQRLEFALVHGGDPGGIEGAFQGVRCVTGKVKRTRFVR